MTCAWAERQTLHAGCTESYSRSRDQAQASANNTRAASKEAAVRDGSWATLGEVESAADEGFQEVNSNRWQATRFP